MSRRTLETRLKYWGGDQLSRINKQKLNSFHWALLNDYNSREIIVPSGKHFQALINTNNLKPDYDKEIVSVDFESGLQAGDVFEVVDDHSHWMVYLPIITETAYLRAEIIKCRYEIEVEGEKYWIYFQGPTETDLRWFIKSGVNYNELNLSGTIYIKNTPKTKEYFKRFTKLKLDGHVWEVQVTDSISVPGIIELEIQEYYDNTIAELPEIIQETEELTSAIVGSQKVKMDEAPGYTVLPEHYIPGTEWEIANNPRVRVHKVLEDGRICEIKMLPGADQDGGFDLVYGEWMYHVDIQPAETFIQGPQLVYPYETHTYWIKNATGTFVLNNKLAEIIKYNEDSCQVRITSSKKGEFKIGCIASNGQNYVLPVTIGSL